MEYKNFKWFYQFLKALFISPQRYMNNYASKFHVNSLNFATQKDTKEIYYVKADI